MTATEATVIDAGVGNIGNLVRALRHLGAEVEITCDPATIRASRCLVLPGVGAFRPPREVLRGAPEEAMRSAVDAGATLLGICIGYQLLFDSSEEFGTTDGLGLLGGRVTELPGGVPLPHIGWNQLEEFGEASLFRGIPEGGYAYFLHSFYADPAEGRHWLAATEYGARFASAAGNGRVFGIQFHPEKSGRLGARVLSNFLGLDREEN